MKQKKGYTGYTMESVLMHNASQLRILEDREENRLQNQQHQEWFDNCIAFLKPLAQRAAVPQIHVKDGEGRV